MADFNGANGGNRRGEREMSERINLGILSQFLGAILLVLLGGLFVLDRILLSANKSQAATDAQTGRVLTESFLASRFALLDGITVLAAATNDSIDNLATQKVVRSLFGRDNSVLGVWIGDENGENWLEMSENSEMNAPVLTYLKDFEAIRVTEELTIVVRQVGVRHAVLALIRKSPPRGSRPRVVTGLVLDANALGRSFARINSTSRLTIGVVAGVDTIAFFGSPTDRSEAIGTADEVIRLPTMGVWHVVTTQGLTAKSLRWALWALGILGSALLAVGLLQAHRRASVVADRSVELERLYSDVKRANQAKSEFLANVSHELRTPLNAIVGFVELLRDGFYGDLSPRQVLPVDRIAASATHLRHLVDQVLDIAKIAAGRLEVHPELIVLRPFVLNIASELESLIGEKALTFSISVSSSLPRVRTDPTHLRQILINLIGNAVKYTPAGTISVRARLLGVASGYNFRRDNRGTPEDVSAKALLVQAPRSGTWVVLQVVDTGVGIARDDVERIFDEFEQVNAGPRSDSMQRGTGLGLAISRRLARLLGGEISVESKPDRGSTFTVWLSVNPADLRRESVAPSVSTS